MGEMCAGTPTALAALLADPARVAEVPADERQAVLDALAVHEGRCRLVRELLTAHLARGAEAKNGSARPQPPFALHQAAGLLDKNTAWLRRKAQAGRVPGAQKVGRSWMFDRASFDRWRSRREVG
jgi:Helix-turn-helix domain